MPDGSFPLIFEIERHPCRFAGSARFEGGKIYLHEPISVSDGSPVATRYNAALLPPLRRAVRNIAFVYVRFHSAYSWLENLVR
jgi:hypothetical protein